ncbi:hypothetical protein EUA06_15150 [Nocardioides glacieisoli]|uniref:Uncharacterized protein n=1 Tax=Nocardioides glacieisoli TaxID=1168730 RepID=A0A4Q2RNW3_9ACTN|nr:hypothetical protein [Nocardioides glacieisoli]RYB89325.1 hypothetical protein EUA06_15150 [Nocardioides glacieisoli]
MSKQVLIDAPTILAKLAMQRPVFHSEADFQFAFAWEAKRLHPDLSVRLETHPEPAVRLDLELFDETGTIGVAVELKYMTRSWSGSQGAEKYVLKNHGASDLRGYDVVKDIGRVERFVAARPGWSGIVIALTNEGGYWRRPSHGRPTNADAFRLYEGCVLDGERSWGPNTGGTARGREAPLNLRNPYVLKWADYSRLDASPAGTFRSLVVPISGLRTNGADR